jgi:hypothetical protein
MTKLKQNNNNISNNNVSLSDQVKSIPGLDQQSLHDIITGMYAGKPLLGQGGLLTNLVKSLTQIALHGERNILWL